MPFSVQWVDVCSNNSRKRAARLALPVVIALTMLLPSLSHGQQPGSPGGRSEVFRPPQAGQSGIRSENVNGRDAVAGEVLFRFRDEFLAAAVESRMVTTLSELRQAHDAEEFETVGNSGVLRIRSRSKNAANLIRELARRPEVLYAEPNYVVSATSTATNDPRFGELWGLQNTGQGSMPGVPGADIKAVSAWNVTRGAATSVVAVVDTGVDYNHPDLAANMWRAPAAFSVTIGGRTITCAAGTRGFNAITNTCDPLDDQDHGTHVAGTIGAVGNNGTGVVGVSQVARIMALKFLNAQGTGTVSDAIKAIEFAIATKTYFASTNGANVRILNNSWGGDGFSQALLDTIRRAHQADMLFVASAGNDSFDIDFKPTYPASYKEPNVITVAATNNRDDRAWFSNYGATSVHLAAPGDSILSTIRTNGYKILSGTSMASPHVSGAAALILSNCPVGTTGLKDILLRSVDKIPAMSGITTTGGRLNVAAAVNSCTVPYYTLAATPAEATIGLGMTGKYTVTITPFKAFAGAVTMSVADLPAGVTATFQPATAAVNGVVTSSILTLTVGANVLPGVHRFTIQGSSANQQRTTWASVRIPGYAVADLGSLPVSGGTRLVEARDVNNSGQVVGTSNATASGSVSTYKHAFLYSGGVMRDLGTLGGVISSAASVSGPGHVVGSSHTSIGYEHAFLYSAGKMIDLGTLPGHYDSFATGVNDSGHVVGYSAQSSSNERAFLRTTGALVNLGTLPNGNRSRATGLNNLGHVVGYSQTTNYSEHAFLYSNGTMKDLGTIGANASGNSHARAINDAGQIAGWSTVGSNLSTVHAFLYSAGKVQDLGALPGYPFSYANGLNGSGHVVGFVAMEEERFAGEKKRAFLYRNGRMLDLNETLQPGSAWVLLEATAINDNGAIAGVGKMNGETRAFLLTPLQ